MQSLNNFLSNWISGFKKTQPVNTQQADKFQILQEKNNRLSIEQIGQTIGFRESLQIKKDDINDHASGYTLKQKDRYEVSTNYSKQLEQKNFDFNYLDKNKLLQLKTISQSQTIQIGQGQQQQDESDSKQFLRNTHQPRIQREEEEIVKECKGLPSLKSLDPQIPVQQVIQQAHNLHKIHEKGSSFRMGLCQKTIEEYKSKQQKVENSLQCQKNLTQQQSKDQSKQQLQKKQQQSQEQQSQQQQDNQIQYQPQFQQTSRQKLKRLKQQKHKIQKFLQKYKIKQSQVKNKDKNKVGNNGQGIDCKNETMKKSSLICEHSSQEEIQTNQQGYQKQVEYSSEQIQRIQKIYDEYVEFKLAVHKLKKVYKELREVKQVIRRQKVEKVQKQVLGKVEEQFEQEEENGQSNDQNCLEVYQERDDLDRTKQNIEEESP